MIAERITVRPFTENDYEAMVEIWNAAYPDYPETVEENRFYDERRDPKCMHARFVAELGEHAVGIGLYTQFEGMYHPRKFYISAYVRPENQGQGVGAALYEAVMEALMPFEPISLRTQAREDHPRGLRFLESRGFSEDKRDWESRLDVLGFNASPYEDLEARLAAEGIAIKTLAELSTDPEMTRKFYDLFSEVRQDVPRSEPATPISFEQFYAWTFEAPEYLPEASFIALDGDDYVGMSQLWKSDASNDLFTGLTAVRRDYRRRKVALALKLRGIHYAKEAGAPAIRTDNDSKNLAMLAINEKLGFKRQPAWIGFVKTLREEET
jgi:GNAT superfamily N-acetyltransferase